MTGREGVSDKAVTPKVAAGAISINDVRDAAKVIAGSVRRTDLDHSQTLSAMLGCEIWLKFENLQFTGSFKERGALNRLSSLNAEERKRGVIAMSAGNHAQGVAYHAHRLGIPATIVMPEGTPTVKVENTRGHGANVILHGATLEDAAQFSSTYCDDRNLVFIHPFDDPRVIAGQGTIALEMIADCPELDTLVVPIGGGGLISGMAVAAKAINPDIRVIGVEAALYPSMHNATRGASLPIQGDTLAEGIAVKSPGELTAPLVEQYVDDIILVDEAALERAVSLLIAIEKTVVEGAGAA
ncbi:MAG: pyridoxal-phosphate dependent enzyme, partial [Pseudomonadota bacterium]